MEVSHSNTVWLGYLDLTTHTHTHPGADQGIPETGGGSGSSKRQVGGNFQTGICPARVWTSLHAARGQDEYKSPGQTSINQSVQPRCGYRIS